MDQGVTALIIVSGLVTGIGCLVISAAIRRRRHRSEITEVMRALGGRPATPGVEPAPELLHDPISGDPYSDKEEPYASGFLAEYRGHTIVGIEFDTIEMVYRDGHRRRRTVRRHVVKVLGPALPTVVLRPQQDIPSEPWPSLQTTPSGDTGFDNRYDVRAQDSPAAGRVLTPAAAAWLKQREDFFHLVVASPYGLEIRGTGVLPGWNTTGVINDLCDLAELIEYGSIQSGRRLERQSAAPPASRVLTAIGVVALIGSFGYWITAFTISSPRSGLAVILTIVGLALGAFIIERLLNRRARRRRERRVTDSAQHRGAPGHPTDSTNRPPNDGRA